MSGKNLPRANHKLVRETNVQPHTLTRAAIVLPQPMQVDGYNELDDEAIVLASTLKMDVHTNTKLTINGLECSN